MVIYRETLLKHSLSLYIYFICRNRDETILFFRIDEGRINVDFRNFYNIDIQALLRNFYNWKRKGGGGGGGGCESKIRESSD